MDDLASIYPEFVADKLFLVAVYPLKQLFFLPLFIFFRLRKQKEAVYSKNQMSEVYKIYVRYIGAVSRYKDSVLL